MRKSLVCDIVEPFRVIIDVQVKKSLNLKQFRKDDFVFHNGAYSLNWNLNKKYVSVFLEAILEYKSDIFCFILSYYRAFMKQLDVKNYEMFKRVFEFFNDEPFTPMENGSYESASFRQFASKRKLKMVFP